MINNYEERVIGIAYRVIKIDLRTWKLINLH